MKTLVLLTTLCLSFSTAFAEISASHRAVIEKLLTTLQVDQQYTASTNAGFESGLGMSSDQIKSMPQAQQDKFNNAMTKVKAMIMATMSWEKVKPAMVEAYAQKFSEQEAAAAIALMDSPAGQRLISKQVGMVGDVMKLTQGKMKDVMPQITQIIQQEMMK